MRIIDHHIVGHQGGAGSRTSDVFNPNTGKVQASVNLGSQVDLDRAVAAAQAAQPEGGATNPQRRPRVMFSCKALVEAILEELAHLRASEHGKVVADARGDVQRGLDVVEFACGIPHALKGEYTQGAGPGIDVYSMRQPLGVVAGITPFNFPAMLPLWMGAVAIACGNAFILKPSERDPSVPVRFAELFLEAGLPEGIFQVIQGDKEMVDAILDHPAISAVSFVGSSDIAQYVYSRGVAADAEAHYGPVVNAAHKQRVENWIQTGVDEGAELVVDGRGFTLQGHEDGFFVGPSLFDHVTPDMQSYKEEIFGPVLQIVRAPDFETALRLPSEHQYGNGVAIFTRNGHAAREFAARVNVGMVGINVPIPVPVAYHSFGGWKRSGFGDIDQHGMEGVRFWTKNKKVTQRWPDGSVTGENAFVIPTMG